VSGLVWIAAVARLPPYSKVSLVRSEMTWRAITHNPA
jgi:hypothetical protein